MDAGWSLFVAPFLIYFAYRIILLLFQCIVYNKFDDGLDVSVPLVLVYLLKLILSPIKNFKMFVHGFFPGISEKYLGILIFKIILIGLLCLIFLKLVSHQFWNQHILQVLIVLFGITASLGLLNELVYIANHWRNMYEKNIVHTVLLPLGNKVFWNNTTFAFVIAFLIYGVYTHFLTRKLPLVGYFIISLIVTLAFIAIFVILRKLESKVYDGLLSYVKSNELNKHWVGLFEHLSTGNKFKLKSFFNIAGPFLLIGVIALIITVITRRIVYPDENKESEGESDNDANNDVEDSMKRFAIGMYIILFIGFSTTFAMIDFGSTRTKHV